MPTKTPSNSSTAAECRFSAGKVQLVKRDGEKPTLTGYGAVFYKDGDPATQYQLWSDTFERIMPGAFDRALREDDVRSLFNHDSNIILGRNRAGTLKLSVDEKGLKYDVTPPDTQLCRDQVLTPIDRGDVSGSSFMFVPLRTVWVEEVRDGKTIYLRQVEEVQLWEVGPVVFPAYEGTTTGLRASGELTELKASLEAYLAGRGQSRDAADAVKVRADYVKMRASLAG